MVEIDCKHLGGLPLYSSAQTVRMPGVWALGHRERDQKRERREAGAMARWAKVHRSSRIHVNLDAIQEYQQ